MDTKYCYGCMKQLKENEVCSCGFDIEKYNAEPYQLLPGTELKARYIVGTVIGEGGFGITYVGYDNFFDRKVAVKEFYMTGYVTRTNTSSLQVITYSGDKKEIFVNNLEKFLAEGKILVKYNDIKGIVSVYDFFKENDTAYLIMEFVEGVTLKKYCKEHGPMDFDTVRKIFMPVIDALSVIHKDNYIHRDISPENIMITNDGRIKLLDFGAAREYEIDHSKTMSIILRQGFAPEEQYRSKGKQGPWTDVYSICATMYYCMTGKVPTNSVERLVEDDLIPICEIRTSCSKENSDVIMKGLSVFKDGRYQSMAELKIALEAGTLAGEKRNNKEIAPKPAEDDRDKTVFLFDEEERNASDFNQMAKLPVVTDETVSKAQMAASGEAVSQVTPKKKHKWYAIALILVIFVSFLVLLAAISKRISNNRNTSATLNAEEYSEIGAVFEEVEDSRDLSDFMNANNEETNEEFEAAGDLSVLSEFKNAKKGDKIFFGAYEQDNDFANGAEPIEWYVLDNTGNEVTLLSVYNLDVKAYKEEENEVPADWPRSSLRKWLNDDFYNQAFNEEQQLIIKTTHLITGNNPLTLTRGGIEVSDKIYLLSLEEIEQYFGISTSANSPYYTSKVNKAEYSEYCYNSDSRIVAENTKYSIAQGSSDGEDYGKDGFWLLRSPGGNLNRVAMVDDCGRVFYGIADSGIATEKYGVRPALTISY